MDIEANLADISSWLDGFIPGYGDIVTSILIFAGFLIFGYVVYHVFEKVFRRWAKKTTTKIDDEIIKNVKRPIYVFVIVIGLYYAIFNLTALSDFSDVFVLIFTILEVLLVAYILTRVVNVFIAWYAERQAKKMSEHIIFVMRGVINFIIYLFAFLIILFIRQIDLTGAVVGLGVGGIAIAFALQNVLGDFFSAFTIYFDKPFEIGDFIIVGDYAGTVKKIGMKSTRVKLLQGEELVLANSELTKASVRNFKKMRKRRIVFTFGVTYDTSSAKLKKIPDIVKKIVDSQELADVDRVHFTEFGDFSLNFEVVYYMKKGDYVLFMDTQQDINFGIKDAFEKEEIEMAFPTQTIFVNKT